MPGTPATSPRLNIPRFSDSDPSPSFSTQVNEVTDAVDSAVAKIVPVVTTLPTSPADGDEVYYVADASNGVLWHFRYRAASTSAHKWESVGSSDLSTPIGVNGTFGAGNTGNSGSAGPAAITAPFAGDYDARFRAAANINQGAYVQSNWNPPIAHGVYAVYSGSDNVWMPIAEDYRLTGLTAGEAISVILDNANGTAVASIFNMQLFVRPVRVG